ncbi:TIGR01621 family pseudouridine synthase [Glaciecola sp. XM2]|uniref:TIGR01621 family pseudouridine synthase n=1 Tax=Glaciecola sp. XM2 TaxID=1914931 RepID=UPI001BDE5D02|nr:TIGR01621 family pseudouridine synthase [Glaciecola sp. XM2]MBT1450902.1 TIGR01621 family pseudouridine synthase [Glaciecola sp. XM2]
MTNLVITTLYEHEDFVVINKPIDVAMHDAQNGIISVYSKQRPQCKWFLVHRLDTQTSGCLILAKSSDSAATIARLFAKRSIEKYYLALSNKTPKKKQGLIRGDMKKARSGSYMLTKTSQNPAITQFFSKSVGNGIRGFICKPHSGKTHQIRVALKSIGASILGDMRYGASPSDRMYLHSYGLCFSYKGESLNIFCLPDIGEYFSEAIWPEQWLKPNALSWPKLKLQTVQE